MRKRFFLFLALVATTSLWAEDFIVGGINYNYLGGNNVEVTHYRYSYLHKYEGSIEIPNTVYFSGTTYNVTSIGDYAFEDCSGLTSVTIPNSVTTIGDGAFDRCSSLTSVTIPNSVTTIGYGAFSGCSGLTSVTIPNSVTSIGNYAFSGCSGLTSVTIGSSVTSIGDYAFYRCSSLTSPVYNAHCFAYMPTSCNGAYTIPEGIKQIAGCAFCSCSGLTSITIPNSVTSIGAGAFYGCSALTSITIPQKVTSIEDGVFSGCSALTSITIPKSVTSIGDDAFSGCSGLTSVTIPNSVTSIGDATFYDCSSLLTIKIPNSVTTIGGGVFAECTALNSVNLSENVKSLSPCMSRNNAAYTEYLGFFEDCYSLDSIVIPDSVNTIGREAFYGCGSLTSITIPNGIKYIGDNVFSYCPHISEVLLTSPTVRDFCQGTVNKALLNSGVDVDRRVQIAGKEISEIVITNTSYIEDYAFYNCPHLSSVIIDDSVKTIGLYAFAECDSIKQVTLSNLVTDIGSSAFYHCSSLDSITLTASNIDIFCQGTGNKELLNSGVDLARRIQIAGKDISDVKIENATSIEDYAFYKCPSISSVVVGNKTTRIGGGAFSNSENIKSATIGNNVKDIGANAFAGCTKLYDIYCYAAEPPTAEDSSFANYNAFLHVPCESQRFYMLDVLFGEFKYIECIASDEVPTNDVIINPGTTDVTITWPTEGNADTYTIVIKKGNDVFCTLTFNAEGQLLNIAFAPGRNGNRPAQYAEQAVNGYRFTVTSLESGTKYGYNIEVKDASNKTIKSHSGEFTTQSTTAVDNITTNNANIQKIMRNGQLIILRDGVEYNAVGQEL